LCSTWTHVCVCIWMDDYLLHHTCACSCTCLLKHTPSSHVYSIHTNPNHLTFFLLRTKLLLNIRNRLPRIQMLRTNLRTVHNSMTPVQFERIVQLVQPFLRKLIPRILDPPVRLHEHRWSQILIGIPPVGIPSVPPPSPPCS